MEKINNRNERHELIQGEFRKFLTQKEFPVSAKTEGVVVLSGPTDEENRARVETAVAVLREIAKNGDILNGPPLILNATPIFLPSMLKMAEDLGFPLSKIELIDCGEAGNTKTQFQLMNTDPRFSKVKELTFVTSDYHVPRTLRTGDKNLKADLKFDIIPAPRDNAPYNVFRRIRGEVERIEKYSKKGDISKKPRE